jgi:Bacterial Ig domain/FG-GAP-like repeat
VAIGDLNGDGRADLAVANGASDNVSVLLASGAQGSFAAPANFPAGTSPQSVTIGDLNGDGRLDLVTANFDPNYVSVLFASGAQGNFAAPAHLGADAGPASVTIGDLNGDGRPDLAITNVDSNNVSVLLASGEQGNFATPTHLVVGSEPVSMAIGDLNGDGRPDLATANRASDNVSVLLQANSYPAGSDTTLTTPEDTSRPFAPADFGFTDPDSGDTFQVVRIDTLPAQGSLRLNGAAVTAGQVVSVANTGNLTFVPVANACGSGYASFTFSVSDGSAFDPSSNTIAVSVGCLDDSPVVVDDSATVAQGSDPTPIAVLANDIDIDGGPKTIASVTQPANGTVAITSGGTGLTFQPAGGFCGSTSFTYALNGGSTATVSVTVTCVDDPGPDTTPPETRIAKHPKAKVTTRKSKAMVRFTFDSTEPGSKFACKLDKGAYRPCASFKTYKLKPGRHVFEVWATDLAGNTDTTPAKSVFRIIRRR